MLRGDRGGWSVRVRMSVANGALARRRVWESRARRLRRDAGRRQLGRCAQHERDDRRGATGAEAAAGLVALVRRRAVVGAACFAACRHAVTGVRAMGGARRQRRRNGEHNAEPERPEAGQGPKPDRSSHGITIHRVAPERIPTGSIMAVGVGKNPARRARVRGSNTGYHNTLTVSWWCRPPVGTNIPA